MTKTEMKNNISLLAEAENLLDDLYNFVQSTGKDLYTVKEGLPYNASLGKHVRHILNFYENFTDPVLSEYKKITHAGSGAISLDYEKRKRSSILEENWTAALEEISSIKQKISDLSQCLDERNSILLCFEDEKKNFTSENDKEQWYFPSSMGRELNYLMSHTIHHFAILNYILFQLTGRYFPQMGMARSTERFEESAQKMQEK